MDAYIDFTALGQVLLTSLVAGAGLVAFFALGMVGWSAYEGSPAETGQSSMNGSGAAVAGRPAGLVLAVLGFGVVVAGIAVGIFTLLNKS